MTVIIKESVKWVSQNLVKSSVQLADKQTKHYKQWQLNLEHLLLF